MKTLELLKKQHLSMFGEKRNIHKKIAGNIYLQYLEAAEYDETASSLFFSQFYRYFSENFPAEIYDHERIVGTNWHWLWQSRIRDKITPGNIGHFIPDFKDFLKKGIAGKLEAVKNIVPQNDSERNNKISFEVSLGAFSDYIKRYAESAREAYATSQSERDKERLLKIASDCEHISVLPPVTFCQALQLVWFIQCYLDMEAGNAAISLGRIDQYLYPYYKNDIKNQVISPEEALELIACFYIKISEGNESCMLTVGGDEENELSALFLEAQTLMNMRQPSISLRVSDKTSNTLLEKAKQLVLIGSGMPAYFNDDVIIKGLKGIGIDEKSASDYGIVGCYEAAPQGSFSNTVASSFNLYDSFEAFLDSKNEDYPSFEAFLDAYKAYFESFYESNLIPRFKKVLQRLKAQGQASPFASCALRGCYEKGHLLGQGGGEYFLFGLNILGIGLLIDSMHIIKKFVYDEKYTTIEYLNTQAKKSFEDNDLYAKIKSVETHYGSNSPESNDLANKISSFIGKVIARHSLEEGIIVSPALFAFTADIRQRERAGTVSGRKEGELLSYGIMPCATPHKQSITSSLLSSANIACEYFPNGCPAMITLSPCDIEKNNIMNSLIKTYFKVGGYHIAINTVNEKILKEAKQFPTEHADVMIKISGFSAQFVSLDEGLQVALIERAGKEP